MIDHLTTHTTILLTLFPEPTFFIWVKERMHQIIAIVLWDFKWFFLDTII
jgi:hypothetical protein